MGPTTRSRLHPPRRGTVSIEGSKRKRSPLSGVGVQGQVRPTSSVGRSMVKETLTVKPFELVYKRVRQDESTA